MCVILINKIKKYNQSKNNNNNNKASMVVWAVFFAGIIAFMGLGLVDPILPAISSQLGASQTEATLLFSGYNAIMAVAMLITGFINRKLGTKITLLAGIALIAIFAVLCGLGHNVWEIIVLRCGWGLGNAIFIAVALTTIISFSKDKVKKSIIMYEAAIGLGLSIGPIIGGLLGGFSWRFPFFGVGFLMFIAFLLITILMPKHSPTEDQVQESVEHHKNTETSILDPIHAMKHKHILIFGFFAFLYNFGFFTLLAYAPFVLNLSAEGIGLVFLCWGVFLAINSVIIAPKIRNRLGSIKSLYLIVSLFAILLLIMGLFTSIQWVVILATALSGILIGNINTLLTTVVMDGSPIDSSTTSSAYNFLRFIGSAIAPVLAGFLGETISPSTPFLVGFGFCILAIIFLFFNIRRIKHLKQK
ncbi:MFS transporter [Methanobrevibacter sp. TMH8]|uniref:MFS transporter n=1 Tax=Methanobrevibacter sp. TMH8 TaxID=2848611 RepID=UPI001CCE389C